MESIVEAKISEQKQMNVLSEITLLTNGSKILLVLCAAAAIAASWFVYRQTIPPVSKAWRILFAALRASAAFLIILMLFEPILSITRKKQEKPIVAVLVDNSASMKLVDAKIDRPEVLQQILTDKLFENADGNYRKILYTFSSELSQEQAADSLEFDGDGTDISRALVALKEELSEQYFASTILITDGANNLGINPGRYVEQYGVPVHTIGIGDPAEQNDVLITNYVTNEVAYAGNPVPVEVYVKSNGFSGERIPVNLTRDNKPLDTKMVTLSGDGLEQKVRLTFTPETEGLFKYDLSFPGLEGELTRANNNKNFYIRVLKSKLNILIISGGPSADLKFLKRTLLLDENIEIENYIEKPNGSFYKRGFINSNIEKYDCIILQDYPRKTSPTVVLNKLNAVLAKGKPVAFMFGQNTDFSKLWRMGEFVPFKTRPVQTREQLIYPEILPQGIYHPLLKVHEDEIENRASWRDLPPVFMNIRQVALKKSATSLATIDLSRSQGVISRNVPLITAFDSGNRKSVAIAAYGLWRWDLLMQEGSRNNENYKTFVQNIVRWLTTVDDSKLVRVKSNKEIYRSGEQIKFTSEVYYENYQPVDGAEVTITLQGNTDAEELTLTSIGGGRYEGSFQVLQGGDYNFTATAHKQGRILGRDNGKFSVEEFSLEFQNTRMDEAMLKRIAQNSGGKYFTPANFSGLRELLNFPQKYITTKNEFEIWNKPAILVFIIVLLGLEWLLRKRKGML